ncbi:sec1 family domain-containing protein 2 isoform X3 [Canis lupus familiaris]|nr:sec1 family domain-containing protein 2 isoform X3 [Canis lupus familiaris]XP_038541554.1 sec1 family domain-containing protein 2 isoform X3 [Canis lupus familiaris]|eukprot:XP_022282695.1 sec1 family domain-containing protein 2 isoform X2 [Canis lupus familiaris]
MSAPGVLSFTQQGWEQVLAKVKRALVYLDAACAESLHWGCGASRLLEAVGGPACHLREFEPAAVGGGAEQPKAVFVLSCLLKGRTVETLREIIGRSRFQYCVVVTAVSHAAHLTANHVPAAAAAELEGQPVFEQLEEKLCEWMGNMNYTAEVLHVPLWLAPVAPHLALTPAFASLFPLLPRDVHLLNRARPDKRRLGSLSEVDAAALPPELLLQIRCLVSGLSSLCEHLGVREECFAVGSLSRIIAADLASYAPAKNRRKTAAGRASVVFVDRTLDLTGAAGHHGDNLVEKIISVLPQLPGHTNDVMVNMVELTALQNEEKNQSMIAPGCLAQSNDTAAKALWEALLSTKHKEAVMEVRRHLVEAASRENLPIKMSMGRVTPGQLMSYIQLFKNNLKAIVNHCGLLQLGLATVQTLKHPQTAKWDNFLAFERLLLQSIGESTMSVVLNQLLPMIKPLNQRTKDDYSPEELLILLIYVYSVSGEFTVDKDLGEADEKVKEALARVFCEESELSPLLQKITALVSSDSPARVLCEGNGPTMTRCPSPGETRPSLCWHESTNAASRTQRPGLGWPGRQTRLLGVLRLGSVSRQPQDSGFVFQSPLPSVHNPAGPLTWMRWDRAHSDASGTTPKGGDRVPSEGVTAARLQPIVAKPQLGPMLQDLSS